MINRVAPVYLYRYFGNHDLVLNIQMQFERLIIIKFLALFKQEMHYFQSLEIYSTFFLNTYNCMKLKTINVA